MTIKLFSLSQRKADIPDFTSHFLAQSCQAQSRPLMTLSQSDLRRLISYAYPGNIIELAAILNRAVIMSPAGQLIIPEAGSLVGAVAKEMPSASTCSPRFPG